MQSIQSIKRLSWIGGIIDGEGSIQINRYKNFKPVKYVLAVVVVNCDKSIIDVLQKSFPGGISFLTRYEKKHRKAMVWSLCNLKAEKFLKIILPYLVAKKNQAEVALNFRKDFNRERGNQYHKVLDSKRLKVREKFFIKIRKLKHLGMK